MIGWNEEILGGKARKTMSRLLEWKAGSKDIRRRVARGPSSLGLLLWEMRFSPQSFEYGNVPNHLSHI
jgi:hypothetical protein